MRIAVVMLAFAAATTPVFAQRAATTELATGAVGTIASRDFWGAEVGVARRSGSRRAMLTLAGGSVAGAAAVRVRATAQFLVRPRARSGMNPYAGLGIAWAGEDDAHGAAFLAVVAGVEAAPAVPRGWYLEIGLEGGIRLAAGLRWRPF